MVREGNYHFVEGKGLIAEAFYIPGRVSIKTVTAGAQEYDDGGYLVKNGKAGEWHGCAKEAFEMLYKQKKAGVLCPIDHAFTTHVAEASTPILEQLPYIGEGKYYQEWV